MIAANFRQLDSLEDTDGIETRPYVQVPINLMMKVEDVDRSAAQTPGFEGGDSGRSRSIGGLTVAGEVHKKLEGTLTYKE